MMICHCALVGDSAVLALLDDDPAATLDDIRARVGAGADCGGCVLALQAIIDHRRADADDDEVPAGVLPGR